MSIAYYDTYFHGGEAEKLGQVEDPTEETTPEEVWPIVHAATPAMETPYVSLDGPENSYDPDNYAGAARRSVGDFFLYPKRGYWQGASYASTNISSQGQHNQFQIAVDGGPYTTVTISVTGKTTGLLIAAELENKIQALGAAYENVTVVFTYSWYTIHSGTEGNDSRVSVASATDPNRDIATVLKLDANVASGNGGWHKWPMLNATLRFTASGLTEYPVPPFRFWYAHTWRQDNNYWGLPLIAPMTSSLSLGTFPSHAEDGITIIRQQFEVPVLNWKQYLLPQYLNWAYPSDCPAAICLVNETSTWPTAPCHSEEYAPAHWDLEDIDLWNNCAVHIYEAHLRISYEIKSGTGLTLLASGPNQARSGVRGVGVKV